MKQADPNLNAAVRAVHLAGAGACVLVVAAASGLFFVPTVRAAKASQAASDALNATTASLAQAADLNRSLNAQIERLESSLAPRRVEMTGIDDLNRRLAELTGLCVENGLTPEVIQPREVATGGVTPVVPIRFEVTGTTEAVFGLLGLFDAEFPDLHILQLSLDHTAPGVVRLRCVLSWLTRPKDW